MQQDRCRTETKIEFYRLCLVRANQWNPASLDSVGFLVVFTDDVNKQNVGGISPKEKEIYVGGGGWLCSHSLRRIIRVLVETDRTDFIERGDVFSLRNTEAFLSATRDIRKNR